MKVEFINKLNIIIEYSYLYDKYKTPPLTNP